MIYGGRDWDTYDEIKFIRKKYYNSTHEKKNLFEEKLNWFPVDLHLFFAGYLSEMSSFSTSMLLTSYTLIIGILLVSLFMVSIGIYMATSDTLTNSASEGVGIALTATGGLCMVISIVAVITKMQTTADVFRMPRFAVKMCRAMMPKSDHYQRKCDRVNESQMSSERTRTGNPFR